MPDGPTKIPIAEEALSLSVEKKVTGRVRVTTKTHALQETATVLLEQEDVNVKRVPIGVEVEQVPGIRVDGDTTILPVMEEILVVEKRLFLKEEIHITRSTTSEKMEIPVTLRKQEAIVERDDTPHQTP